MTDFEKEELEQALSKMQHEINNLTHSRDMDRKMYTLLEKQCTLLQEHLDQFIASQREFNTLQVAINKHRP